jgi:nucleotide-binding universal stress UspA family protein
MFERVLVSMDLSPATEALVSALPGLSDFGTREIILAHVVKQAEFISQEIGVAQSTRRRLGSLAERLEGLGFKVTVETAAGAPASEITRIARERHASAILVGTRSHTRLYEAFVGSVAWDIVRRAQRPVLLHRIEANRPDPEAALEVRSSGLPQRVVHATDFSVTAERAKPWLERLAALGVREFTLLHTTEEEGAGRDQATIRLEQLAQVLRDAGATLVDIEVRSGSAAESVLSLGGRNPRNMVVMGTQGKGALPEFVLGSESRQVARAAAAPILLVPSPAYESA